MITEHLMIENIPAILWGEKSNRVYLYVHGKMSNKEEALSFAKLAIQKNYQVLSFDLPEHGERKDEDYSCNVWNGIHDLAVIIKYVQQNWAYISLYATSLGAYFSLLAYKDVPFEKCLFVSPLLNMEKLIINMMRWNGVSEEKLQQQKEIPTSTGENLDWDYYSFVKENPIVHWAAPTAILYGSNDNLTEREIVDDFVQKFHCDLTVLQNGEHWFHTEHQRDFLSQWLCDTL